MDDLEEHAAKHSSHLAKTDADYRRDMMKALLEHDIPMGQTARFEIYESLKLPPSVYKKLDLIAFHEAMSRRHAIIVNW